MPGALLEHFERAAADIAAHGDNDTLPFDTDTRFVADNQAALAAACFTFYGELERDSSLNNGRKIDQLSIFSERLLAPTGPAGFRASTKIQPFWNLYFNGLATCIAANLEATRSDRVHSYRYVPQRGPELFDRARSWRAFREITVERANAHGKNAVVVQTDISSFYEHASHHHAENFIDDLMRDEGRIGNQVTALLGKFSAGRSFGFPVGGQASRILAELFLNSSDHRLTADHIDWYRYVDDYVLVTDSNADAYKALALLSHALADYGLTLNKTKTVLLTSKHYADYVRTQLGGDDDDAGKLREIDLRFDPYSDAPSTEYDTLKETIESLQVHKLLNRELEKSLPDTFLITQIGRTLRVHDPKTALEIVETLLKKGNLHAFRASWSTIMRGIAKLRATPEFDEISGDIDALLDAIPEHSGHLLQAETSLLHYLRTLRFASSPARVAFVRRVFQESQSTTVRRGCIDCWRWWRDRDGFTNACNRWQELNAECQRIVWLAASSFGDQGDGFKRQNRASLAQAWRLGIERQNIRAFSSLFEDWCEVLHGDV